MQPPSVRKFRITSLFEQELAVRSFRFFQRALGAFPAFSERNYRLYFSGQFISLVGTWLQNVAQGWLVFELTHSAYWVGVVSALASLPILFFVLFGGIIVDRFPRKRIIYVTQIVPMILASILGVLTVAGIVTLLHICILAFLLGLVNALDIPARQAFVPSIVKRRHLASAIALNSVTFNGARIIGPSAAGILITAFGIGTTFFLNAASFLAIVGSLFFIRAESKIPDIAPQHPWAAIKEGWHYTFSRPTLSLFMIAAGAISIFGWSYASLLPVMAGEVFKSDAGGLGLLHTAAGIGALGAALLVSLFIRRVGPRPYILGGNAILSVALFLFSFTVNIHIGFVLLFLVGLALIGQFSVINSTIQHSISDHVRGRVMSIYALFWRGSAPIGAFLMGYVAEHFGAPMAIRMGAIAVALVFLLLVWHQRYIPAALPTRTHETT